MIAYIYCMKRTIPLLLSAVFSSFFLMAQSVNGSDSSYIVSLNQQIDNYVVQQNITALDTMYAGDFVFSHGTGMIEGKAGWIKTLGRTKYPSRQHDSVKVELHPGLAIARGKLFIQRMDAEKMVVYQLRYVRVYALRNKRWQMISHITTHEQHEQ
jgi:Domain of unknown function (DUF4440)